MTIKANDMCKVTNYAPRKCNLCVALEKMFPLLCVKDIGKGKAVPLHAMEALGGRGGIAPTHSLPRH
jgi:hypothetical protein